MNIKDIFNTTKPSIGMIHLLPTIGYEGYESYSKVLECALKDLHVLEEAGFDAVMIENNYDVPHKVFLEPHSIVFMTRIVLEIVKKANVPIGLSILWNDYLSAIPIAKMTGIKFIRIPVFVDDVETSYGKIFAAADPVQKYMKQLKINDVALFTDIHVKHSKILSGLTLEQSALLAIKKGSSALIITGKWTADKPLISDLERVRAVIGNFPIIIGSGADKSNINELLNYANGVIIGTSIKEGRNLTKEKEVNIRHESNRISLKKAREFMQAFK